MKRESFMVIKASKYLLYLILLAGSILWQCKAEEFEVEGKLVFTVGTNINTPVFSRYKVQKKNDFWTIEVKNDPYYPFIEKSIIGSDNTNLYQLDIYKSDSVAANKTVNCNGFVKIATVPDYDYHHFTKLWLVYASSSYLNQQIGKSRLPCSIIRPKSE